MRGSPDSIIALINRMAIQDFESPDEYRLVIAELKKVRKYLDTTIKELSRQVGDS